MSAAWIVLLSAALAQETPPIPVPPEVEVDVIVDPPPGKKPVKPRKEWSFAALPIANYSSDTGVGGGFYSSVVHNSEAGSDDPFRARAALQLFITTKAYQDHNIKLDFPGIGGSKYRWDLLAGYEAWKQSPYYGEGNLTPRLPAEDVPNDTYNIYDVRWLRVLTNLRRPIVGNWLVYGSYLFRYAVVNPYADSLLDEQSPRGLDGGNYARLAVGIMYDSRDMEPTPTAGVFSELSVRVSAPWVGSRTTVVGINATDRRYVSMTKDSRLVFANRVIVDVRRGAEPFWVGNLLGGSSFVEVGGGNNLRGLQNGRYRGDSTVLWTPELRIHYGKAGPIDFFGVPFFDLGRVFLWKDNPAILDGTAVSDPNLAHLHWTAGLGHRFQVGQAMLVRLDVGVGREEYGVVGREITGKPNLGIYLTFDHPF